jgi:RNA polymerase sigma factor (sigma-70 family)
MPERSPSAAESASTSVLLGSHRQFVKFLERRLRSRELAEEILQASFLKALERKGQLRKSENVIAWFYRLLRNAVTDHRRRQAAEARRLGKTFQDGAQLADEPAVHRAICSCITDLVGLLKPEYATLIQRVDLEGTPLPELASELTITPNNAGVRLHRARKALKKQLELACGTCTEHGCLDCSCRE